MGVDTVTVRLHRAACLGALAVLALLVAAASHAAAPSLYFHYASDCTFSVVDDSHNAVTTLAPGTYQVVVDSPFAFANETGGCSFVEFSLTGPNVSVATTLGTGDSEIELFTVTLQPSSTYVAVDNNSPTRTRRTFTTAASGSPTQVVAGGSGTTSSPAVGSKGTAGGGNTSPIGTALPAATGRGTLVATVKSNGTVTLTKNGKPVQSLAAGRYDFTVRDESSRSGFTMQAIRSDPIIVTSGAYVGKRAKSLTLRRGQWLFYGSFVGKKTYFLVTA